MTFFYIQSKALDGLHIFTGNDCNSAFRYKGKLKALQLMMANEDFQEMFAELGTTWHAPERLKKKLERFVCCLYGDGRDSDIDDVRYNFLYRDHRPQDSLPPTKDSLDLHTERVNYERAIHKRSLRPSIQAPPPEEHGWIRKDNQLVMNVMTLPAVPDELVLKVTCSCAKSQCQSARCSCRAAGIPCADFCKCENCQNTRAEEAEQAENVYDAYSESDSDSD